MGLLISNDIESSKIPLSFIAVILTLRLYYFFLKRNGSKMKY